MFGFGDRRGRRRIALAVLGALFGLPPLYMAVATPSPGPVRLPDLAEPRPRYRVYLANWGYHTSVLVEQPSGWRLGPPGEEDAPLVEYAWGERAYFKDGNQAPHVLFAATFLPTASVMYVDGWVAPPGARNGVNELWTREVSADELRAFVTSLEQSFVRTPTGERAPAFPPVAGRGGHFFPAREFYIWWSDCNAWSVKRLGAADLAEDGPLVVTASQVAPRLRGFGHTQAR